MPNSDRLRLTRSGIGAMFALALAVPSVANAGSVTIMSDGGTLSAVEPGTTAGVGPTGAALTALMNGDTSGVTFTDYADVGAFGTFTGVPSGAPAGVEVINIYAPAPSGCSACNGQSGFFEVTFTLPSGLTSAAISGAGNVDDAGYVFLNGNSLGAPLDEFNSNAFGSSDLAYFKPGLNTFIVADNNSGGGPSGAAFYATITYGVPEASTWALMLIGFGSLGFPAFRAGRKERFAKA